MNVRKGFFENIAELAGALHFGHKGADGNYLSLIDVNGTCIEHNFILVQEFKSFSQNGPVIEWHQHSEQSTHTQTEFQY